MSVHRVFVQENKDTFRNLIKECLEIENTQEIVGDDLISWVNILHYVISKKYEGPSECLKNILINYLYSARKAAPGSEQWFLKFLVSDYELKKILRVSSTLAAATTQKMLKNKRSKNIFKNIPTVLGATGKIIVSREKSKEDILKVSSGCSVSINIDPRFSSQIKTSDITLSAAKVLVIEGAPFSVSELNKLLTYCYDNKTKLIMLARSYPEEVITTLSVNWQKNKLNIVPFIYGDELSNLNSHADLAAISGAIPISTMLGDTFNVDFEEKFGNLTNVEIKKNSLLATQSQSPTRLIKSLNQKIKDINPEEQDTANILYDRLAGLSSDSLNVYLKESYDTNIVKDELDVAIPYYGYMCYSACEVSVDGKTELIPYQVYKTAEKFKSSFITQINSIGGYLVTKNK